MVSGILWKTKAGNLLALSATIRKSCRLVACPSIFQNSSLTGVRALVSQWLQQAGEWLQILDMFSGVGAWVGNVHAKAREVDGHFLEEVLIKCSAHFAPGSLEAARWAAAKEALECVPALWVWERGKFGSCRQSAFLKNDSHWQLERFWRSDCTLQFGHQKLQ